MRSDAGRSAIAVTGAFLMVLVAGTLGWALLRGDPAGTDATWTAAEAGSSTPSSAGPTGTAGTTGSPTVTPTPTTVKTTKPPAKKKVVPKTTATQPVDTSKLPVANPPQAGCAPTKTGTDAAMTEVKAALVSAANRKYWDGVVPEPNLTVARPVITIPVDLMKAVAWQESGWQSAIVSCDGGVGVMQIQTTDNAQTDKFVNLRFGENFDVHVLADNASIGAAYLEYLIMWFGINFFDQNFDLSVVAPVGPKGEQFQLLDVVLAAYNFGAGKVVISATQRTLSIPADAMAYVNNVKALRASTCPCQNY